MATLDYQPRGRGFEVRLATERYAVVATGTGLGDSEPAISGSSELKDNVALMALLLGYAANELDYRRLRTEEKRKSRREAADVEHKDARALADMVEKLGERTVREWCSGCFSKAARREVRGAVRPRTYLCAECGTPTVDCAVPGCSHHAVIRPRARITLKYCAEHTHAIPGFDKLNMKIPTLGDYRDFLEHEVVNAERLTKVAGGTIGAAAVIAPMALFAAPAIGAALGGSLLGGSLTGAAATSHGLAMLGGGAIASGGLGMAGGTAVVAATGTAIGGALGATTASAYTEADKSFAIELVRPGVGTPVVFATGFLTEGRSSWAEWQRMIDTRYPDAPVYEVHWGAKELKDLTALVASSGIEATVVSLLEQGAKRGSKAFGLPGIGWVIGLYGAATNPWTVAKTRAGMTGVAVAELIARTQEDAYVLIGHSLGARVMVTAAQSLGTRPGTPRIESMHLLGAAVGRKGDWHTLDKAVTGTVWNYYSTNDNVLRWLYKLAEIGQTATGQAGFTTKFSAIKDRNVSRKVAKHSDYVPKLTLEGP